MFTHARPIEAQRGFTLMELLVVVTIIGILAAIAIPNYSQHVTKSRRAQAASCLQEHAQFMERYYTTNLTYAGAALPGLGCTTESRLNSYYSFSVSDVAQKTYTLKATPQGSQATADTQCGTLSLNQLGTRSVSGTGSVGSCF